MITWLDASNLIDQFQRKLPDVIYGNSLDEGVYWNNEYQMRDTAKKMAITCIEREIKILESIRGVDITFHNGKKSIPIENKIQDLFLLIKEIKELI